MGVRCFCERRKIAAGNNFDGSSEVRLSYYSVCRLNNDTNSYDYFFYKFKNNNLSI